MSEAQRAEHHPPYSHAIRSSVDIDSAPDRVFELWLRLERLPQVLESIQRVQRVSERRTLWDADVYGRQFVWEAEVTLDEPTRRLSWKSRAGAPNQGNVQALDLPGGATRLEVEIHCQPRGLLEKLGARLGLLRRLVDRELERFRVHAEGKASDRIEAAA